MGELSLFFNMFASIVGRVFLFREQLHKEPYSVPEEYIRARISLWLTASATFCVSRKRHWLLFFASTKVIIIALAEHDGTREEKRRSGLQRQDKGRSGEDTVCQGTNGTQRTVQRDAVRQTVAFNEM